MENAAEKTEKELCSWLWSLVLRSRVEHAGFSMLASERMCRLVRGGKVGGYWKLSASDVLDSLQSLGCDLSMDHRLPLLRASAKKKTGGGDKRMGSKRKRVVRNYSLF